MNLAMDAYSSYTGRMSPEDEEHTSFMTDQGTYCYKVMPFGLKNAGATYQRLVNKMFEKQIGRNMEVYVDDMLVKSRVTGNHIRDLGESFEVLRQHQMKLNPAKCVFGVASGRFLGFIVSQQGIEANPKKIKALANMAPPRNVKDVQRLTGRLTAFGPITNPALNELKRSRPAPPLLAPPKDGESRLYSAKVEVSLSSVLVRQEFDIQQSVYYVSKTLTDPETRYPRTEKMALALIVAARKLRPYFQAHRIVVLTDQPLKGILQKPDIFGRLVKWAIKLGEFDIEFKPRPAIKAQALADFIVETTTPIHKEQPAENEEQPNEVPEWALHVDGSSTGKWRRRAGDPNNPRWIRDQVFPET
ncbi:hypothetical protein Nepgr_028529 [Nepenthes gracilis]|uniref:Reverse transcriptase domain-containing protein n=1 Tax=Nepenthes gracilis TaxID=150966 RepID=A0AAD3Y4M7_NEPGR|nr:hypothetical protein Nepgr_028529 [Nepenthes gracilis]